jgi:subtilase family serine protease
MHSLSTSFRSASLQRSVVLLLAVFAAISIQAAELQTLEGQVPKPVQLLLPTGQLPATNRIDLSIALPMRNAAALSNLLQQIYDPASPLYRHYLTTEQFTEKFGRTEQDYQAVINFAKASHLKVTETHSNRLLLDVSGSVADVERTLHVTLNSYQHPTEGRSFYAPDREPSLNLSVPILHIGGLDNYALPKPHLQATRIASGQNAKPNAGSGPSGTYMGKDFRAAYVPDSTLNGSGQTVGLLEFDGYTAGDITYYEKLAKLKNVPLQNILLDGFSGNPTGDGGELEVSLDIEVAISMATNMSGVIVYEAGPSGSWHDILNRMADDNLAKQLSCSWYIPEGGADPVADQIFQQMAVQGQSFFNASGDSDAYTGLIDFPGDTPYITEVGGTTLTTAGPGGAWASETVWNWGIEYDENGVGSSGGISTQYPIPTWQTNINMAANQGSTTKRNTPDVALTADNVYVRADGGDFNMGGTSCAAPLWAGFAALVNQQAIGTAQPVIGFINPAVDEIASGINYSTTFHDIRTGNNTWGGSPNKFYAVAGYDLCTGWGTPAGQHLINALANPEALMISPTSGFSSFGGVGGPFFPASSQSCSLTNIGTNTLTWTLSNTSVWLTVSSSSGKLTSGGPATTVTISLNSVASNLLVGTYSATLWFTNVNDNSGQSRQFSLSLIGPPVITQEPANQAVLEGAPAYFSVQAGGGLPLAYQWQFDGTNLVDGGEITGSSTSNLTVRAVSAANVGNYAVVVTNYARTITSSNASLTIVPSAPVITMQPANGATVVNGTAQFAAAAIGTTPFTYQWSFNGTNLLNATNATLTLGNVQFAQAGNYSAVIGNIYGATNSSLATLTVYSGPLVQFFDDFTGPALNPIWQASLPDARNGGNGGTDTPTYLGAPNYYFETLGTNSVLRMTNLYDSLQRCGWSTITSFPGTNFTLDVRYNTVVQSSTTSIDGFIEVWIFDTANTSRYDIISPFGGDYSSEPYFFAGSSIDGTYTTPSFQYQNNTWYHLVLQSIPGENLRGSIYDDNGNELIGYTFDHDASAYPSGFQIALSQSVGNPGSPYPGDVAVDYVKLTSGFPPQIVAQPTNQTVNAGGTAAFAVTAYGTESLVYQWSCNGINIAGATNAALILTDVQVSQSGSYMVQVTNLYGSVLSSNAWLLAGTAPVITNQPASQSIGVGGTASFTVGVEGSSPLYAQWFFNGAIITGATNCPLTLTDVQLNQSGNYAVVITNTFGSVASSNATLTVLAPPVITSQPINQSVPVGSVVTISAVAVGTAPLAYQWTFDTTNLPGATNTTLTLANVQLNQGGAYALLVTNAYGSVASSNAVINAYGVPPFITTQPANQSVAVGGTATFTVVAGGTPPLSYQWSLNNTNISTATNSSLTLANVQSAQAGNYQVKISSPYGTTNSAPAVLTVLSGLVTYFFDDFNGPTLNPIWQTNLPPAHNGGDGGADIPVYLGGPNYAFQMLATNTVLYMTNFNNQLQRRGWSSVSNFASANFYYDLRFNTLLQSSTISIDGFIEIWIIDAANTNNYDIISPFEGDYSGDPYFFMGSSIDNYYNRASYKFLNNTWYHLVLQSAPGQNMRGSIYSDNGVELVGQTFSHSVSAYPSGFKIAMSQSMGRSGGFYPQNVDVDYVRVSGFPPTIVTQPTNVAVAAGGVANFAVTASGALPLSYQWQYNGASILGATNPLLTLTNVQIASEGNYFVTVTNLYGSATSSIALLTVDAAPVFVTQPTNLTVAVGSTAVFATTVTGSLPLSYQWTFSQTNLLPGMTNASIVLTNVQLAEGGVYALTVTNLYGTAVSSNVTLTVANIMDHFVWNTIPSPRFANAPFGVTIEAMDADNQLFTDFNGTALLTTLNGVPVRPPVSTSFSQGVWTGTVTISQPVPNMVLQASDGAGHSGLANSINVINLPAIQMAQSGTFLLLFWPTDPAGFVLETTTNLASSNWAPVMAPPVPIGNQYLESIQLNGTNQFYRLQYTLP